MAWKRAGSCRNSLISCSSSTASSQPATSAKVTDGSSFDDLLGAGLAELHDPAAAALHDVHDQQERADEQHVGSRLNEQAGPQRVGLLVGRDLDRRLGVVQLVDQLVGVLGREGDLVLGVVGQLADDLVVAVLDLGRGDLAVVDRLAELGEVDLLPLGRPAREPDAHEQDGGADEEVEQGGSRDAFHGAGQATGRRAPARPSRGSCRAGTVPARGEGSGDRGAAWASARSGSPTPTASTSRPPGRRSSTSSSTTWRSARASSTPCASGRACCTASPRGSSGEKVHQKRVPGGAPPWLETVRVHFPRYGLSTPTSCA